MPIILCQAYYLSLQDIQQAGNVHSVKDTVPYRKAHLLKINPRQYEETLWEGIRAGRGGGRGRACREGGGQGPKGRIS